MKLNKIVAGTSAVALSLAVAGVASVSTAANSNQAINLQVEVQETLSFDCYDILGASGDVDVDMGIVTAGTPVMGGTRCNVLTNDDMGYYLTVEKTTDDVVWADAGGVGTGTTDQDVVMTHEDVNVDNTWYGITETAFTEWSDTEIGTGTNMIPWVDGTTTGFAFTVENFPDTDYTNSDFSGTEYGTNTHVANPTTDCVTGIGNNDFASVGDTASAISAVTQYDAATTVTDICYKLDVASTQQSGIYGGQLTYTATTDASAYPSSTLIQ